MGQNDVGWLRREKVWNKCLASMRVNILGKYSKSHTTLRECLGFVNMNLTKGSRESKSIHGREYNN